jgi:RNA methyltransferase, TrmH family
MPSTIKSRANRLIKLARALRKRKAREESGLFLAEGILHVGEAVAAGWEIEAILYSQELISSDFAKRLVLEQIARGTHCYAVPPDLFGLVAEKENPQGILAILHERHYELNQLNQIDFRRGVAIVSPQDPGNVGTIMRSIDAVGCDGLILLDGGVDPYHPTLVRASMGTFFWLPTIQSRFIAFIGWARQAGYSLLGTSAHGSIDFREIELGDEPWIMVLGNEQKGLSEDQAAACDKVIRLPMRGRTSSLNLAVAAGVLLYSFMEGKTKPIGWS